MCYISRYQTTFTIYNITYNCFPIQNSMGTKQTVLVGTSESLRQPSRKKGGSTIEPTVSATSAPKHHVVSLQSHPLSLMRRTENERTIGGWHDSDVVTWDQNQGVTPCQESWHDNGPGLYNFETHDSFNKGIFAKNYASLPTKGRPSNKPRITNFII